MSDLQTAYYIIAIVFMGLIFLIGLVATVAVLVIRSKIVKIHHHIEDRFSQVAEWAEAGTSVMNVVKKVSKKHGK